MLHWALAFFLLAILAAVLAFTSTSPTFSMAGKALFSVFLSVFLITLMKGVARRA